MNVEAYLLFVLLAEGSEEQSNNPPRGKEVLPQPLRLATRGRTRNGIHDDPRWRDNEKSPA